MAFHFLLATKGKNNMREMVLCAIKDLGERNGSPLADIVALLCQTNNWNETAYRPRIERAVHILVNNGTLVCTNGRFRLSDRLDPSVVPSPRGHCWWFQGGKGRRRRKGRSAKQKRSGSKSRSGGRRRHRRKGEKRRETRSKRKRRSGRKRKGVRRRNHGAQVESDEDRVLPREVDSVYRKYTNKLQKTLRNFTSTVTQIIINGISSGTALVPTLAPGQIAIASTTTPTPTPTPSTGRSSIDTFSTVSSVSTNPALENNEYVENGVYEENNEIVQNVQNEQIAANDQNAKNAETETGDAENDAAKKNE